MHNPYISEVMEKTFQAAQLTHERFLTIDHSCKIFCRIDLWLKISHVLVVQLETFFHKFTIHKHKVMNDILNEVKVKEVQK